MGENNILDSQYCRIRRKYTSVEKFLVILIENYSYLKNVIEKYGCLCYHADIEKETSGQDRDRQEEWKMRQIDSKEFQAEVLESKVPVLVDFSAVWCGPCQMMGPVLEQLASEYEGKAKIVKVDIDASADLAMKYRIMSVPNMIFFQGGEQKDAVIGAVPATVLKEKLDRLV